VLPEQRLDQIDQVSLRDYQTEAVGKLVRITQGYLVMPCGSGKTRTALGAIARLRTPTLVLVHTTDLAAQWRQEIRNELGVEAGLIGSGQARVAPITVGLVQALVRWPLPRLDAYLSTLGFLVVDELHHCPAVTFRQIIDRCPARYRLGLTATPEREEGLVAGALPIHLREQQCARACLTRQRQSVGHGGTRAREAGDGREQASAHHSTIALSVALKGRRCWCRSSFTR
jgi:superfamily II DNA or RNA helicase